MNKTQLKERLRPIVESILKEEPPIKSTYYTGQLSKIDTAGRYAPWVQFGSEGQRTNNMNLTTESIPVLIAWLKKVQRERAKAEASIPPEAK